MSFPYRATLLSDFNSGGERDYALTKARTVPTGALPARASVSPQGNFVPTTLLLISGLEFLVETFSNTIEMVADPLGYLFEFVIAHRLLPFLMSCHRSNRVRYRSMFSRKKEHPQIWERTLANINTAPGMMRNWMPESGLIVAM